MFGKNKYPLIEVATGKQLGKTTHLRSGEYSIGTHKKCQIRLDGEYVSELHAIIKQDDDGVWSLSNNSPNGTFVDEQQVDQISLSQNSTINIGVENRLHFKIGPGGNGIDLVDDQLSEKKKTSKWVWIAAAVVLIYVPMFAVLSKLETIVPTYEEPAILTLTGIENAAFASNEYLSSYQPAQRSQATAQEVSSRSMGQYEMFVLGFYQDDEERSALIESLVAQSKAHLTSAHHYTQMNLNAKAEKSLRRAMAVVPDHRYPVVSLASRAIADLKMKALP